MQYEIPIGAKPKARPRVTRNGTFMPKEYMNWKREFANELLAAGAVLLDQPQSIIVDLWKDRTMITVLPIDRDSRSGMLTGDVDNYLGGVMDAAINVLYLDDGSVHRATVELR